EIARRAIDRAHLLVNLDLHAAHELRHRSAFAAHAAVEQVADGSAAEIFQAVLSADRVSRYRSRISCLHAVVAVEQLAVPQKLVILNVDRVGRHVGAGKIADRLPKVVESTIALAITGLALASP